jgi:anti-sigma regulatory factor (Ser/Thr protein kinase)
MSAAPTPRRMTLDLPAVHDQVVVARNAVRIFARMQGVAGRELDNLLLVVSELLANAVDHGGGGRALSVAEVAGNGARMELALEIEDERCQLQVSDQGGGDVAQVRALLAPDAEPDLEDERGRGLFLLRQMVERIDVEASRDGRGLRLCADLRFHRDDAAE